MTIVIPLYYLIKIHNHTIKTFFSQDSLCCGYGKDGIQTAAGYDCLLLPLVTASPTAGTIKNSDLQCGNKGGIGLSTSGTTLSTICCKFMVSMALII